MSKKNRLWMNVKHLLWIANSIMVRSNCIGNLVTKYAASLSSTKFKAIFNMFVLNLVEHALYKITWKWSRSAKFEN